MNVSWRHMLAGASICAVIAAVGAGGLTASGQACCIPPVQPPQTGCCNVPRQLIVNVPGVSIAAPSVSVGASAAAVAVAGASATTMASGIVMGGGGGSTMILGGGGGGYIASGVAPSAITGLQVDGGYETRTVEEEVTQLEDYCIDKIREELQQRPVQAMCVDDKNAPHPASRLDEDTGVDIKFNGEIYRCMAGTHMQVTLGALVSGSASFAQGETFSCAKGEALWHSPGGKLSCRPQAPERNCNERSLLRRFGPGVKMVEIATPKPYCEPAQRTKVTKVSKEVKVQRAITAGDLQLDGGVGQGY